MYLSNNTILQGGKYKIIRHISSGGFGNTYEGVQTIMNTKVAIKEFFPKMFCSRDEKTSYITFPAQSNRELVDKLRKKFIDEAKTIFKMNHPNIVKVHDIFEENGTAYYVMDYIDGKSLGDLIKQRCTLPEAEAIGYIRDVADALKYVHSLNRLHLDIKPGNIMIDKNCKVILIDFGASKHYDMVNGENTSTLMGLNTKGYAPVEQSTQSFTKFSPATDLYALGATLYKLLTGVTPPDANLLLAGEESLMQLPSNISVSTRNAVSAAMALKRIDRPQCIDDFITLLNGSQSYMLNEEATVLEIEEKFIVKESQQKVEKSQEVEHKIYEVEEKNGKSSKFWIGIVAAIVSIVVLSLTIYSFQERNSNVYLKDKEFISEDKSNINLTDFECSFGKYKYTPDNPQNGYNSKNRPQGLGTARFESGHVYHGNFVDGNLEGNNSHLSFPNGDFFDGTFKNNLFLKGKYTVKEDGSYFEGTFKNGQPDRGEWHDAH